MAEQLTDISDTKNANKTRKSRVLSSDDSNNEKHLPQKKLKEKGETATKIFDSYMLRPELYGPFSFRFFKNHLFIYVLLICIIQISSSYTTV